MRCGLAFAVAGAASLGAGSASAAAPPLPSTAKPADPYVIEVKFRDDTALTATGTELDLASATQQQRLDRIIGPSQTDRVVPVFASRTPAELDAQRAKLEQRGKDVPDLTSFVRVTVSKDEDPKQVLRDLAADPLVESAQVVPALAPAPGTGSFSGRQTDLWGNFEIGAAASVPGALGDNVRVVDVEYGLNTNHEDLVRGPGQAGSVGRLTPNADFSMYDPSFAHSQFAHGTAVAGIIAGKRDGVGVDGIAPNVDYKFQSDWMPPRYAAEAILDAADAQSAGDVMTLEMQSGGPESLGSPYVPSEYSASVRASVVTAVAKGIIVVAAAGNGGANLDDPAFEGSFSRSNDSGAIIVGASNAGGPSIGSSTFRRTRASFSAYGSRVDLQALGESVTSTGYGDLFGTSDLIEDNNDYTAYFSGTSSATAIMGGIAAALSSAYEQRTGQPLTPALARQTLVSSGLAQNTSYNPGNIGPQPRLKSAIDALPMPPETDWTDGEDTPVYSNDSTPTVTFAATPAAGATFECAVGPLNTPYSPCTSPLTLPQQSGSAVIVRVRAKGPTGLVDPSPLARAIFFDYVAPNAPTISAGPDSGTPNTTGNTSWTFASTGETVTYQCQLDVGTWGACASPYTLTNTANGSHTFNIRAKDRAGNVSTATSRTFSVAVPAPTAEITSGPETGGYVNSTPTFAFSSPTAGVTFECVAGAYASTAYLPCTSPWNAGPQPEGGVIYKVRAKTPNGTVSSPAMNLQFHDYTAPPTTITSGPANGDVNVGSSTSFTFSSTESGATFECKLDAGTWVACTSPKALSGLANGAHTFNVRAKDRAGNLDATPEARTFTVGPLRLLTVGDPVASPATATLTSDASLGAAIDWVHWKGTTSSSIDRKSGTVVIPAWTDYAGNTHTKTTQAGSTSFSWTNATGTASDSSSLGVSGGARNGRGFTLAIPAKNTETRKLKLWLGVRGSTTTGALNVAFNGETITAKQFSGNSNTVPVNRTITVDYRPLAANDTLTVSWFQGGGATASTSQVVLYAAAVY